MRHWKRRGIGCFWIGLLLLGLCFACACLLPWASDWLDVGEPPRKAGCVMVLPGDEQTRPFVAAALVKAGLAEKVLVPKVFDSPQVTEGLAPPTHEIIRGVLNHCQVSDDAIVFLEGWTSSTFGDAQRLDAFLKPAETTRVMVVTNDYHSRRARWVFRRVLGQRSPRLTFVSAPTDSFVLDQWWRTESGFSAVFGEYLKLTYYAARYGQLGYWLVGMLALLSAGFGYRLRRRFLVRRASSTTSE